MHSPFQVAQREAAMLAELDAAIPWLKQRLMLSVDAWNSIFVCDEEPHVERLWFNMKPHVRVALQRIHHCSGKPLIHGHTRPAAFLILDGIYRTAVGHCATPGGIPDEMVVHHRRAGDRFAMADPNERHWVNPITATCLSIMVTGEQYQPPIPERAVTRQLFPLDAPVKQRLFRDVRQFVMCLP